MSLKRVISSSAANGSSMSSSFGLSDEGAGDRDAHLHAAGQFARIGVREAGEADQREALARCARAASRRETPRRRSGSQTLSAAFAQGISVGSWNTKPISPRWSSPAAPGQSTAPAARLGEARDDPQRRRLAAAGGAEERHELARADVEIEAGERRRAVREGLANAAQRDQGGAAVARGTEVVEPAATGPEHEPNGPHPAGAGRSLLSSSLPTPLFTNCSV